MAGARKTPRVRVGTCGFREARGRTFHDLGALEVQRTFDPPPRVATAERFFNHDSMTDDARRLLRRLRREGVDAG